jgi:hypothetical protein
MKVRFIFLLFAILVLGNCKNDPKEVEIGRALRTKDLWKVSILCADYKGKKYHNECLEYTQKAEKEINHYISQKKDLPFFKMVIEKEVDANIRSLLEKNIHLGIKYRTIWEEISEKRTEEEE